MEQLQIHSRSYLVRWVPVKEGESISWSLQPNKKSLNFGIFKHPGGKAGTPANLHTSATFDTPILSTIPNVGGQVSNRRNSSAKEREASAHVVVEKLTSIGLKCVSWPVKCEADQVSMGRFDVQDGEAGMYGLLFDNTFSKTVSKTATFVLMTHPTTAPPKSGAQLRYSHAQAALSSSTLGKSPSLRHQDSNDSLPQLPVTAPKFPRRSSAVSVTGSFYTGVMHKRRRKKNQGYARRFFSLDFTSSTLSYYRNSHASALRGSIPLALAAIGVDEARKEFSIDSGAEVWHLRLRNKKDFESWKKALEKAMSPPGARAAPPALATNGPTTLINKPSTNPAAEREWARVEELIGRVSGSRDAMRRLAQDTDPKYAGGSSPQPSPTEANPFFIEMAGRDSQKLPFWKRKPSSGSVNGPATGLQKRSFSVGNAASHLPQASPPFGIPKIKTPSSMVNVGEDVHDRCLALLRDLNATVSEFSALLAESKARRRPLQLVASRLSIDSARSVDDFYDAEEGSEDGLQIMSIRHSDDTDHEQDDFFSDEESITSSDAGGDVKNVIAATPTGHVSSTLCPDLSTVANPLEIPLVVGRPTVPPPRQPPPSIIGFLRKNAGKDLSTVAMPVTANEPTSLLQRLAEPLENASLLSTAAGQQNSTDRLIYVSAFAVATLASNRVKERAVRKPFNPMLGETYELVRRQVPPGASYRFVAEKVSHHPVRMAWEASALDGAWSIAQSPRPTQKFWGKSVEVNTEGPFRLTLRTAGGAEEHYSWTAPTAYLRNVIAGEKYTEPVGALTVLNESGGEKAIATFKASGLFSGRSEDVAVALFAAGSAQPLSAAVAGKWTAALHRADGGDEVWRAGPLVPDAGKAWGFSVFAAGLNEVTAVEEGRLPPTDSRLRPDQRALEEGLLDQAEGLKARLEERQRARRKVLEGHGGVHRPRFFERVDGEDGGEDEVWRLKGGREGYWECRQRGSWADVPDVFEL